VARPSHGWNLALSWRGGIRLRTGWRKPVGDKRALRGFRLALENGDILVQAVGRTVRPEFWRSEWSFEADGERLSSRKDGVTTLECIAPHLVVPQATEGLDPPVPAKNLSDTAQPSRETDQISELPDGHKSPQQIIEEYVQERERQGLPPNIDKAYERVRPKHPKFGRERCRQLYRKVTGRGVDDRGRSGKRAPPAV
jgi:hypothetical protein